MFRGVQVRTSDLCVTEHTRWKVEPMPIRKRRRGWRVVRHTEWYPTAYRLADGSLVVHPKIYELMNQL